MKVIVHRGASQIGGCITEIATDGCKIIIDLGTNLPGSMGDDWQHWDLSPSQVESLTADIDAIFYTHYHSDHVGLLHEVPAHVPQYIGSGAKAVLLDKWDYLHRPDVVKIIEGISTYTAAHRIDVGGKGKIFVTPYWVSHSAFDAYMLKIECEDKVLLHTGDFRRHGYLGKGLLPMLKKRVGPIDLLIVEGTLLGRVAETVVNERDIQQNTVRMLRDHKYVFALCSSTDMERLASFHAACRAVGRVFCVDKYQRQILDTFTAYAGDKLSSRLFDFSDAFLLVNFATRRVRERLQRQGFLMPVRPSHRALIQAMLHLYDDEPAWLIYSLWQGYAEVGKDYSNEAVISLRSMFGSCVKEGTCDGFHTSGHADIDTLRQVCTTLAPRLGIIPIHKESTTRFPEIKGCRIFTETCQTISLKEENLTILLQ